MTDEQHNTNLLEILNTLSDSFNDQQHHNAQMFAELKNAVSKSKPSGGHANKTPNFRGNANEDMEEFIQQFTRYADFYNWPTERRFHALPLNLQGPASTWYNAVHSTITSYHILLQRLKEQFNSDTSKWVLRQQLASRTKPRVKQSVLIALTFADYANA